MLAAGVLLIVLNGSVGSTAPTGRNASPHRSPLRGTGARQEAVRGRTTHGGSGHIAGDLGEMIVARYTGVVPTQEFLQRIRAEEIGGVILFSENTSAGASATERAIVMMQRAARAAHDYPLLIMTDQEGGTVKRLPADPPARAAAEMTSAGAARAEGLATGKALRGIGINLDLAPVADVEQNPHSFLGSRAFSASPERVAERACAFADGLAEAGIGYTLKHFPGLGLASASTDTQPVVINAPASLLRTDYDAYRKCARGPRAVVMVSSAGYPSLTGSDTPAVLSPEVYEHELPAAGVQAPTISDDLDTPAIADLQTPARRAINAGLDMLLYAQTEASSAEAYPQLLTDLSDGSVREANILHAAAEIGMLKEAVANHAS